MHTLVCAVRSDNMSVTNHLYCKTRILTFAMRYHLVTLRYDRYDQRCLDIVQLYTSTY
jgi:hypothetical protein